MKIAEMRCSSVLLALSALAAAATPAHAEPPPRKPTAPSALEHYTAGGRLFNLGSFQEAINEYKASALVEPAPATDFNLGQCYRLLGDRVEDVALKRDDYNNAVWLLERFLKESPETPERNKLVGQSLNELRGKLAALATPEHQDVAPPPQQPDTPPPEHSTGSQRYTDTLAWVLTGSGVVSLGVAGGFALSASNLDDEANRTSNQQQQTSLRDSAHTRNVVGATLAIVGGAAIVGGVIKFALHDTRSTGTQTSWNIGVSTNGFVVFGRF